MIQEPKLQRSGDRPVDRHGWLRVEGTKILDQHGQPTQLRGMSLFWSQIRGQFWNAKAIDWLVDDWKIEVVRASMGVGIADDLPGYLIEPLPNYVLLETAVEAALAQGIYVIIDWHDHRASEHLLESKEFFERVAKRWGNRPEVIFEIYNEPESDLWPVVKEYSEQIVSVIRQWAPQSLIVLGTPTWSQDVDIAAADPLVGENLAYAIHFYSSTHGEYLRKKVRTALNAGIALFCSEWSASEATGNGRLDWEETRAWFELLDSHEISWCNWSITDKDESSGTLRPGACPEGGWGPEELTTSGKQIREFLRSGKTLARLAA